MVRELKRTCACLTTFVILLACSDAVGPGELGHCNPPDAGTWTHLGLEGKSVHGLADTPWGLFAGTEADGVFRCHAASGRWVRLGLDHGRVMTLLFVPGPTPRLLAGMWPFDHQWLDAGLFASEDAGRTWFVMDDIDERRTPAVTSLAVDPDDPGRLYMGETPSVLRSEDGAETWEYIFGSPTSAAGALSSLVISPDRSGRVYAGYRSAFGNAFLVRFANWGESWELSSPDFGISDFSALAVDESQPARLWAGTDGGVMRSEDYGETWEFVLSGIGGGFITSLLSQGRSLYAVGMGFRPGTDVGTDLVLFETEDGGDSWTTLDVPPDVSGSPVATLDSDGHLLIGTFRRSGGVWRYRP